MDVLEGLHVPLIFIHLILFTSGYLGTFTLSLRWMNLGNKPVEILIEDVYLLVVPSSQKNIDPEEEEERAQAAKQERLQNAELLQLRDQTNVISGLFLLSRTFAYSSSID